MSLPVYWASPLFVRHCSKHQKLSPGELDMSVFSMSVGVFLIKQPGLQNGRRPLHMCGGFPFGEGLRRGIFPLQRTSPERYSEETFIKEIYT